MPVETPYLTPSQLARRWGVKEDKVLAFIHSGQLAAVNLTVQVGKRPRWRIPPEAIAAFEASRAARPPAKPRTRAPATPAGVTEFF